VTKEVLLNNSVFDNINVRGSVGSGIQSNEMRHVSTITPHWLIDSTINDDVWIFKPYKYAELQSKLKFYWKPVFEVESSSHQIMWDVWKNFGKSLSIDYFENHHIVSSSKKGFVQSVKTLISFFAIEREVMSPSDVSLSDVAALETYIHQKNASYSYVTELLRIFRSFFLNETSYLKGLSFDPYPDYINPLSRVAKRISKPNGHTETLYPKVGLSLLNHALKKISEGDDILKRYDDYLGLKKGGFKNAYKIYRDKYSETFKELKRQVDVLYASSIVVVLSLTAMRKHEMNHIKLGEAESLLNGELDVLTGRVFKTARTSTGKRTERKVIKELKDALSIVHSLTLPMRVKNKSKFLFLRLVHGDGHSIKSKNGRVELSESVLYRLLDVFSTDAGYIDGTLRPHMFRRFFSLMWAWRFETGDMEYLADLLFHNGQEFTKAYTSDEGVWEFITEDLKSLTREVLENALLGEKNIYAGFSKSIQRYQNIIKSSVHVVGVAKAEVIAERLVGEMGYMIMPASDGYCFMSLSRASRAKCGNGSLPDYSQRSEKLCLACPNFGVPLDRKEHWQRRYYAHKKTFETTGNLELKTASKEGMRKIQRFLDLMSEEV